MITVVSFAERSYQREDRSARLARKISRLAETSPSLSTESNAGYFSRGSRRYQGKSRRSATMTYKFTVYGKPQPKQRPRFNKYTGATYTPKETRLYETEVKYYFLKEYRRPIKLDGALTVKIDAYFEPPKSTAKAVRERISPGISDRQRNRTPTTSSNQSATL